MMSDQTPTDPQARLATLEQERDRLKADQQDWRKGVALIASFLGDPADNLSCARIAEVGLTIRANLEAAEARIATLTEALEKARGYVVERLNEGNKSEGPPRPGFVDYDLLLIDRALGRETPDPQKGAPTP